MADKLPEYVSITIADFIRGDHKGEHVSVDGVPCGVVCETRGFKPYLWVAMVSKDGVGRLEGVSEDGEAYKYRRAAYLIRSQINCNLQFPNKEESCADRGITLSGIHRGDVLEIDSIYAFVDGVVFRGYIPRG